MSLPSEAAANLLKGSDLTRLKLNLIDDGCEQVQLFYRSLTIVNTGTLEFHQ